MNDAQLWFNFLFLIPHHWIGFSTATLIMKWTRSPTSKELGLALFNCYNQPNACLAPNLFTCPHSKLVLVVGKHQISRLWSPKRCSVIVSAIHHKFRSPNPYSSEESYNSICLQQVDRTMFEWRLIKSKIDLIVAPVAFLFWIFGCNPIGWMVLLADMYEAMWIYCCHCCSVNR